MDIFKLTTGELRSVAKLSSLYGDVSTQAEDREFLELKRDILMLAKKLRNVEERPSNIINTCLNMHGRISNTMPTMASVMGRASATTVTKKPCNQMRALATRVAFVCVGIAKGYGSRTVTIGRSLKKLKEIAKRTPVTIKDTQKLGLSWDREFKKRVQEELKDMIYEGTYQFVEEYKDAAESIHTRRRVYLPAPRDLSPPPANLPPIVLRRGVDGRNAPGIPPNLPGVDLLAADAAPIAAADAQVVAYGAVDLPAGGEDARGVVEVEELNVDVAGLDPVPAQNGLVPDVVDDPLDAIDGRAPVGVVDVRDVQADLLPAALDVAGILPPAAVQMPEDDAQVMNDNGVQQNDANVVVGMMSRPVSPIREPIQGSSSGSDGYLTPMSDGYTSARSTRSSSSRNSPQEPPTRSRPRGSVVRMLDEHLGGDQAERTPPTPAPIVPGVVNVSGSLDRDASGSERRLGRYYFPDDTSDEEMERRDRERLSARRSGGARTSQSRLSSATRKRRATEELAGGNGPSTPRRPRVHHRVPVRVSLMEEQDSGDDELAKQNEREDDERRQRQQRDQRSREREARREHRDAVRKEDEEDQ